MEIIKKAWIVWHEGMLNENPHLGFTIDNLPIVYAEAPIEAKNIAKEPYNWDLNGKEPQYIDLKVRRAPDSDKVLFEGKETIRYKAVSEIKERCRINERRVRIEKYPDDACFYVQNGYCGNDALWWGKGGGGYVTDINNAQLYTKAEVLNHSWRENDRIWESKHVLSKIKQHVDTQYLQSEFVS